MCDKVEGVSGQRQALTGITREGIAIMATSDKPATVDEIQWTAVYDETAEMEKFAFEVIGEQFIGTYRGTKQQSNENGSYVQYHFRGYDGIAYFINGSYSLREAMAKVKVGSLVRITYTGDRDTGRDDPMKLYTVETGKAPR